MPDEGIVVDASVILKWFHQEAANATVRGYGRGRREVDTMLDILLDMAWDIVSPRKESLSDAAGLAEEKRRLSVYDAVYVALAIQQNAVLITADARLHKLIGTPYTRLLH